MQHAQCVPQLRQDLALGGGQRAPEHWEIDAEHVMWLDPKAPEHAVRSCGVLGERCRGWLDVKLLSESAVGLHDERLRRAAHRREGDNVLLHHGEHAHRLAGPEATVNMIRPAAHSHHPFAVEWEGRLPFVALERIRIQVCRPTAPHIASVPSVTHLASATAGHGNNLARKIPQGVGCLHCGIYTQT